jgi:lactate dehydrogenase-like 2-hydroxyacid dehydrogenase
MARPRVFVTRAIPEVALERLQVSCDVDVWEDMLPPPYETLIARSRGCDGVLTMLTDRIDAPFMDAAGSLRVISQMAVGYDNIDIAAALERGIAVGNTPGVLTEATADLTMALLLAAARRLAEGAAYVKNGAWITWHPTVLLGADVSGAALSIIGFGRIGQAVARRARAFDMRVIAYSRGLTAAQAAAYGVERAETLADALRAGDFISLHVPLTPDTRRLIDAGALQTMKPSAILINTTRGGTVDQAALVTALRDGIIAGAALDVTDPEPLPADDPILTLPNALIVPHIGSATIATRRKMALMAADNLIAGVRGEALPNRVL